MYINIYIHNNKTEIILITDKVQCVMTFNTKTPVIEIKLNISMEQDKIIVKI